jgi:hypothetical protein
MLRSMKDMEGYTMGATDGIIGQVKDFYFDDLRWVIRYLEVETDEGPPRHRVLISPISIGRPNWSDKILPVSLTKEQVKHSPDIDTHKPVSRQQEMGYLGYYGYGKYWGGGGLWGAGLYPDILQAGLQQLGSGPDDPAGHQHNSPHLHSANEVTRYYVHASDGDIGHVQGFLVDEETWAIRYIIVNTSNWWLGHQVIIAPQWIDDVNWAECTVTVGQARQAVKSSPPYDPTALLDREQEARVHAHYGRNGYWHHEAKHESGAP